MAAETVQEVPVEARVKNRTEKRPAQGADKLGGDDDQAQACEDPGLQGDVAGH